MDVKLCTINWPCLYKSITVSIICVTFTGTDDDLPPSHQNRFQRGGRSSGNGRSAAVGSAPLPRMHGNMETQIHHIEQEAYCSVLQAFKAQSDAITWVGVYLIMLLSLIFY